MKNVITLVTLVIFLTGCVSSFPEAVQLSQVGDEDKSCSAILNEMLEMKQTILEAKQDKNEQVGKNIALGVAGAFFIAPLFFIDSSNAHTVEQRAATKRYKRLQDMANERKCKM